MKDSIIALQVDERDNFASDVQNILTKYGTNIKTRLGLHNNEKNQGLILIEFAGKDKELNNFKDELKDIKPLNFKAMNLNFKQ
ncbi:hypothetical protein MWH28_08025 [Natroniella sulfidigena]|uniref:hypothetical protein n=1 Tax=Natroniella sulfidigena TaxID=723921 RepID=UPI00200A8097|nr:hypothetical protein [Natroniella sulfidigena]MCK8817308.1 hypothetical protein [Natroniella sulfidigena]